LEDHKRAEPALQSNFAEKAHLSLRHLTWLVKQSVYLLVYLAGNLFQKANLIFSKSSLRIVIPDGVAEDVGHIDRLPPVRLFRRMRLSDETILTERTRDTFMV